MSKLKLNKPTGEVKLDKEATANKIATPDEMMAALRKAGIKVRVLTDFEEEDI